MSSRPLDIICYAADSQGCGYHRIIVPGNLLGRDGGANVTIRPAIHPVEWQQAARPDVLVFQRSFEPHQIAAMQAIREAMPDLYMIYEIDDLLTEVPKRNYHSSFLTRALEPQIKQAMAICDRVVVTTPEMARWATRDMGAKEVKVVPNYLADSEIRQRPAAQDRKRIRVGWAGGVSHSGDLDLLSEAMQTITNVQWVLFGMKPDFIMPEDTEYHEFVPIHLYMDKLASLNLDLFLAPLESCRFNEAKSDLKLLEAAAVGAAVIATPTEPYLQFHPPVFAWPKTKAEWTAAIQNFISHSYSLRRHHGQQMQAWLRKCRTYEQNLSLRNAAWIPPGRDLFIATQESVGARPLYGAGGGWSVPIAPFATLESACEAARLANADVIWRRAGTTIPEAAITKLRVGLLEDQFTATVAPLASDGYNAFPRLNQMTPVQSAEAHKLNEIAGRTAAGQRGYMPAFSGPCLVIRNQGLRMLGTPDVQAYGGDEEMALVDWTAKATERGLRNIQLFDVFAGTMQPQQEITEGKMKRLEARDVIRFIKAQATPLEPGLRELIELRFIAGQWAGIEQNTGGLPNDYPTWASLKPDPIPLSDGRKVAVLPFDDPDGVPADCDYVLYCRDEVILQPFAAGLAQDALEAGADCVFGDHEEIDEEGNIQPYFKPGVDATLLRSSDYAGPLLGVKSGHQSGSTDISKMVHIPHVLCRVKRNSKELGLQKSNGLKQMNDLRGDGVSELNPHLPESGFVFFHPVPKFNRSLAVIIDVSGPEDDLIPCLTTLTKHTEYPIARIVLACWEMPSNLGEFAADRRINIVAPESGKVSELLNYAASICTEEVLIFITDQIRPVLPYWASSMIAWLEDEGIGAAGTRIFHQAGVVAHAGLVIANGLVSYVHQGLPANSTGYFGAAVLSHEASAVSRDCLAIRRELFNRLQFDTDFNRDFMDADLGVRLIKAGYRQVVDCAAQMQIATISQNADEADFQLFRERHYDFIDPYLNPNLAVMNRQFDYNTLSAKRRLPVANRERVLVINDALNLNMLSQVLIDESKRCNIVYRAVLDGFNLILVAPVMDNSPAFDLRNHVHLRKVLAELQISRVVMPSLIGAGAAPAVVESIRALTRSGVQFNYTGPVHAMICPRLDLKVNGEDCGEGYKQGPAHCQKCVADYGSPFGLVDVPAWLAAWSDYVDIKAAA